MARLILVCLIALLALAWPAPAAESPIVASERSRASLVADADRIAAGTPFRLALRLRLAPGWHTYFENPGDAGAPAELTLRLPDGATAGPIAWPAPKAIAEGPLVVFGYAGEVLLPVTVTPPASLRPGETFTIAAEATWLACSTICVPEEGAFRLDLPVAVAARDSGEAGAFAALALPRPSPFAARIGFDGARGVLRVEGEAITPATAREALFVPRVPFVINAAPVPLARIADGVLSVELARGSAPLPPSIEGQLVLTDHAGGRAAFALAVAPGAIPSPVSGGTTLWAAIGLALLGGLLLNLMPCVFPVLALKAFALAQSGRRVRAHAASYTAGVIASMLAVGGLLVALRAAGSAAGWGFQLTEPLFVALLAWLMLAVGLNLSGVFALGRPVGAGQQLAARGGHSGSFATGVLAVLVATPCTAPFMAVALGAALAMPTAAALLIFAALGLGLAAPYALIAAVPGLARGLPRPGPWMVPLRQALAFPMYGAAAWLAWVLAQQAGEAGVLVVLAGGVLIAFAAWLVGLAQQGDRARPRFAAVLPVLPVLPVLAALALLPGLSTAPAPRSVAADPRAQAWSAERVAALQAAGRGAFVDVTAAWCITCKVNEQVALRRSAVQDAFARAGITFLVADWTRGDPAIGALLRAHRREGVPLYLLYPSGGGAPRVLPQILTEAIVLDAVAAPRLAARP